MSNPASYPPSALPASTCSHSWGGATSTVPPAPAARKTAFPKLLGVGGVGILALCLCIGVIGGFASGLIPNPFASPPTETATLQVVSLRNSCIARGELTLLLLNLCRLV